VFCASRDSLEEAAWKPDFVFTEGSQNSPERLISHNGELVIICKGVPVVMWYWEPCRALKCYILSGKCRFTQLNIATYCDTAHIFRDMIPEESVTRYCTSFLSSDFKFCRRSIKFLQVVSAEVLMINKTHQSMT
jgi:hypothetical protein